MIDLRASETNPACAFALESILEVDPSEAGLVGTGAFVKGTELILLRFADVFISMLTS